MKYFLFLILLVLVSCDMAEPSQKTVAAPFATPAALYPELFRAVQLQGVFEDSKTFVDCTPRFAPDSINLWYEEQVSKPGFDLKAFVEEHFNEPPALASGFQTDTSKTAVEHVRTLWPVLTRPADENRRGSSLIPLPAPYVVPGGRFREVYYWDSYFTMLGLIESDELDLVQNMLDNFVHLIDTLGHIPNGNRTYYKTRSQPPFFSQMVGLYAEEKGAEVWDRYAGALRQEYSFWMRQSDEDTVFEHTVMTELGILNRYYDRGAAPRQESYSEDYELVEKYGGGEKKYRDLRAGAESGWDYSSRWLADGKNLQGIHTTDILPIDLNALLYGLEDILLSLEKDDTSFSKRLKSSMEARQRFVSTWCWNDDGTYEDYDWVKKEKTGIKSLAMMYPLFFEMVDQEQADQVVAYIEKNFLKQGGVITSLHHTGQQWDAPNGWAPLQWITIVGLDNYGHHDLAQAIARRWIDLNERVYQNTGKFVEKYNVENMKLEAGGGEYPVQDGFGWSNGVYLALKRYLGEL